MLDYQAPTILVEGQYLIAGLAAQLAIQQFFVWRRLSGDLTPMWFAASAGSLSLAILANVWVFKAGPEDIEVAMLVRTVLLSVAITVQVPTVAALSRVTVPKTGLIGLIGIAAVRLALWTTTDLVYAHRVDADGAPIYGPLIGFLSLAYTVMLVVLTVRLIKAWSDRTERLTFVAGFATALMIIVASFATPHKATAELLTSYWMVPWVVALQVIYVHRRGRAEVAERQAAAERELAQDTLARTERRSRLALESGHMGWYEFHIETRAVRGSAVTRDILGLDRARESITLDFLNRFVYADDRHIWQRLLSNDLPWASRTEQFRWVRPDGRRVWVETHSRIHQGEGEDVVVGVLSDVTSRKRAEADLLHQSRHDPLTGLANRNLLDVQLNEALKAGSPFALLMMDLDGFRDVNDALGHVFGDRVLIAVARRLAAALVGEEELLARLGGDEFAVVAYEDAAAERLATALLESLDKPVEVDGVAVAIHGSIGIARYPQDGEDAETLLRRSDTAMYRAKAHGSCWRSYKPGQDTAAANRLQLAAQFQAALAEHQLEVHFQPIVNIADGACDSVEALVRWRHPEFGLVPPSEFVDLAEHSGLGLAMTRQVLATALAWANRWRREGLIRSVAVNVSPRTLLDQDFAQVVADTLSQQSLPPEALTLELTENAFATEPEGLVAALEQLDALGVGLAIDDFGTGYSSLAYLQRLPVDVLKIDRAFASGIGTGGTNDDIIELTIEMAHRLGVTVTVEGVEDLSTLRALELYGCDAAQGYGLCRPSVAMDIERFLIRSRRAPNVA